MGNTKTTIEPTDQANEGQDVTNGTETPKRTPVAAKKQTTWEVLTEFLSEYSIEDEKALDVLKQCKISSLNDLLHAITDKKDREELEAALSKSLSKLELKKFERINVESIKNALFFLRTPDAKP